MTRQNAERRTKKGQLEVSGLLFLVIEPPDASDPFQDNPEVIIDECDSTKLVGRKLLGSLPTHAFVRSFS
jgi:hypothetical protein